jgi:hypothetical protein
MSNFSIIPAKWLGPSIGAAGNTLTAKVVAGDHGARLPETPTVVDLTIVNPGLVVDRVTEIRDFLACNWASSVVPKKLYITKKGLRWKMAPFTLPFDVASSNIILCASKGYGIINTTQSYNRGFFALSADRIY